MVGRYNRGVSIDPAEWLAALAEFSLPVSPATDEPVLVPAPFERRFAALVIDAGIVVSVGAFIAGAITMMVWAPLFGGGDFDGPEQMEVLGQWTLFATWAAVALLYCACELFGRPTLGKYLAGLRLLVLMGPVRRRRALRWLLAYLPLVVMTGVFTAGGIYTARVGWQGFDDHGWSPDIRLLMSGAALAVLWTVGFLWAAGPHKQTLAERLSGMELVRVLPPVAKQRPGFLVIPNASVVPQS
jgi:hypothetical protein